VLRWIELAPDWKVKMGKAARLFESPTSAHSNYATDKRAIKEMLTSSSDEKK
jgi:hypothetical protein